MGHEQCQKDCTVFCVGDLERILKCQYRIPARAGSSLAVEIKVARRTPGCSRNRPLTELPHLRGPRTQLLTIVETLSNGGSCGSCCEQVGGNCTEGDPGTYICACSTGYTAPSTGGTCTDIDECAAGSLCGVPPHPNLDVSEHPTHCRKVQPDPERMASALGCEDELLGARTSLENSQGRGFWLFSTARLRNCETLLGT
jgi:hypothetical protein